MKMNQDPTDQTFACSGDIVQAAMKLRSFIIMPGSAGKNQGGRDQC
jgi:hypothetical protein